MSKPLSKYTKTNMSLPLHVVTEAVDSESITVPDMVMPLDQLVERYRNNQSLPIKQGVYTDDPELASLANLSPIDRAERARQLSISIAQKRNELADRNEQRKRDAIARSKAKAAEKAADPIVVDSKPVDPV